MSISLRQRSQRFGLTALAALAAISCHDEPAPAESVVRAEAEAPARAVDQVGLASVSAQADPVEQRAPVDAADQVEVEAGEVLVQVVDRSGAPVADVRVVECERAVDGEWTYRGQLGHGPTTDVNGHLAVPAEAEAPRFAAATFGLALAHSTAEDPTRIVLPEHGSFRIDFREHTAPGKVWIGRGEPGTSRYFEVEAGAVVPVPVVPLDTSFLVTASGATAESAETLDGPTVDGEVVTYAPRTNPVLEIAFRLVDEVGEPLSVGRTTVHVNGADERLPLQRPRDRDVARLDVRAFDWAALAGEQLTVVRRSSGRGSVLGGPRQVPVNAGRFGRAVVPEWDGERLVHLGTIAMRRLPLFVAGRVVDSGGEALEGAEVRVDRVRSAPPLGRGGGSRGVFGDLRSAWARTDRDGRFEIRVAESEFDRTDLELVARLREGGRARRGSRAGESLDPYAPPAGTVVRRAFEPGDDSVEIRFEAMGAIEVELRGLSPALLAGTKVSARRRRATGANRTWSLDGVGSPEPTGSRWTPLEWRTGTVGPERVAHGLVRPGRYDVGVWFTDTQIAVVEDVEVIPRAPSPDARIRPLVLTAGIRKGRAVDAFGEPVEGVVLRVLRSAGNWTQIDPAAERKLHGWTPGGAPREPGEIAWPVFDGVDLRYGVSAPGYAAVEITDAKDGSTFVLKRFVQVIVELPASESEGYSPLDRIRLAVDSPDGGPPPGVTFFERVEPGGDGLVLGHVRLPEGARVELRDRDRRRNGLTFVVPEGGGRVQPSH
ncbi:MAG: hypothetical protein AAFP22_00875 [Planctomycetota bacterium]